MSDETYKDNDMFEDDKNNIVTVSYPEWVDMPEFIQPSKKPFSKIIIRFETEDDLKEFSEIIGQKLTSKTKSIWHPKLVRGINAHKRYVDES